jgi:transcriptional regulator with XRE-family HTH domain
MANALNKFGQRCRDFRSQHGKSIGEQADVFGCEPYEISSIETGKVPIPPSYLKIFVGWLGLSEQDARELGRRIDSNVIAFPHPKGGDNSRSMRLFRKISKMNPNEIRGIKGKPPP